MRGRLEEEIGRAERAVRGGEATAELLLRLGNLYLRADRPADSVAALEQAGEVMERTVSDQAGEVELNPLIEEVESLLERARGLAGDSTRRERRAELLALLEAGRIDKALHDELIRLEVQDGVDVHREELTCPACEGPMSVRRDGTVHCARSGKEGDLCRHTDARSLHACATCGLVVRAWRDRSLVVDPREPPLVRPDRPHCVHCGGRVADWKKHFMRCPKAKPGDFPRCPVCTKRGYHATALRCPRCKGQVAETLCGEPKRKGQA